MSEKITLDFPIKMEGVNIDTLTMRRPKVKDQLTVDKSEGSTADKEVKLFANLCEVTPATIEDLDMLDYGKLQAKYKSFLSSTGKTSAGPASS